MSNVISVENVSKSYRLGMIGGGTLREDMSRWWAQVRQQPDPNAKIGEEHHAHRMGEEFWALQDVSFKVKEGEILGIIGRNGAGKSTLLKILSRVTGPTSGYVKIRGRIASLLEVGTGFHPELTGKENIFLNGTILGMSKAEIRKKFDEIVAFSEIEEFLDTPVKRYSSGMYVRLAFAVAAHLEPEILIVDEVLAVGDAEFQKKCLGKMREVSTREGRTVLFVSHNMPAISTLCSAAIVMEKGRLTNQGPPRSLIADYLSLGSHGSAEAAWTFEEAPSSPLVKLHSVKVCRPDGTVSFDQPFGSPVALSMEFWCLRKMRLLPSFHLYNQGGVMIFPTGPMHLAELGQKVYEPGLYRCSCVIPEAFLNTGTYFVHAWLSRETDGHAYVHVPEAVSFKVINDGTGLGDSWTGEDDWPGIIRPLLPWTGKRLDDLPILRK
jgi:lipopolysaccharide transport system ATP-binding protein